MTGMRRGLGVGSCSRGRNPPRAFPVLFLSNSRRAISILLALAQAIT